MEAKIGKYKLELEWISEIKRNNLRKKIRDWADGLGSMIYRDCMAQSNSIVYYCKHKLQKYIRLEKVFAYNKYREA